MTASAFQATFVKTIPVGGRKMVQFVFEVPVEKATEALNMLGGFPNAAESTWVGIARLVNGGGAEGGSANAPVTNRLAVRAGILCHAINFHHFLNEQYN